MRAGAYSEAGVKGVQPPYTPRVYRQICAHEL
jgi:hypothetical protein